MTRAQKYTLATRVVREWLRPKAKALGIQDERFEAVWADVLTNTPLPRSYVDLKKTMCRRHEEGIYGP